jgi:hypothetical protein
MHPTRMSDVSVKSHQYTNYITVMNTDYIFNAQRSYMVSIFVQYHNIYYN